MKDLKNVISMSVKVLRQKKRKFFALLVLPIFVYICLTYVCDWAYSSFFNSGNFNEMIGGDSFLSSIDSIYLTMTLPLMALLLIKVIPVSLTTIYIAILIHREILIKYIPRKQAGKCRYYFSFTWKVLLISLIGIIFIVPMYSVLFSLYDALLVADLHIYLVIVTGSILAALLISFFSLVLPATAIGKKMSFLESIKLVLKNKVLMFGITVVPYVIIKLILYLFSLFPLHPYIAWCVQWFFHLGLLIFEVSCLSIAYHAIMIRKK